MKTRINRRKRSTGATAAASAAQATGVARSRVSEARKAALVKAVKTVLACQEISNLMARFMTAMNYSPEKFSPALPCNNRMCPGSSPTRVCSRGRMPSGKSSTRRSESPFKWARCWSNISIFRPSRWQVTSKRRKGSGARPDSGNTASPNASCGDLGLDVLAADFIHDGATWKLWTALLPICQSQISRRLGG